MLTSNNLNNNLIKKNIVRLILRATSLASDSHPMISAFGRQLASGGSPGWRERRGATFQPGVAGLREKLLFPSSVASLLYSRPFSIHSVSSSMSGAALAGGVCNRCASPLSRPFLARAAGD